MKIEPVCVTFRQEGSFTERLYNHEQLLEVIEQWATAVKVNAAQAAEIDRLREALENIASERHQTVRTINIAREALEAK